eukprot:403346151
MDIQSEPQENLVALSQEQITSLYKLDIKQNLDFKAIDSLKTSNGYDSDTNALIIYYKVKGYVFFKERHLALMQFTDEILQFMNQITDQKLQLKLKLLYYKVLFQSKMYQICFEFTMRFITENLQDKQSNWKILVKAYVLLAKIYEKMKMEEQALKNLQSALDLLKLQQNNDVKEMLELKVHLEIAEINAKFWHQNLCIQQLDILKPQVQRINNSYLKNKLNRVQSLSFQKLFELESQLPYEEKILRNLKEEFSQNHPLVIRQYIKLARVLALRIGETNHLKHAQIYAELAKDILESLDFKLQYLTAELKVVQTKIQGKILNYQEFEQQIELMDQYFEEVFPENNKKLLVFHRMKYSLNFDLDDKALFGLIPRIIKLHKNIQRVNDFTENIFHSIDYVKHHIIWIQNDINTEKTKMIQNRVYDKLEKNLGTGNYYSVLSKSQILYNSGMINPNDNQRKRVAEELELKYNKIKGDSTCNLIKHHIQLIVSSNKGLVAASQRADIHRELLQIVTKMWGSECAFAEYARRPLYELLRKQKEDPLIRKELIQLCEDGIMAQQLENRSLIKVQKSLQMRSILAKIMLLVTYKIQLLELKYSDNHEECIKQCDELQQLIEQNYELDQEDQLIFVLAEVLIFKANILKKMKREEEYDQLFDKLINEQILKLKNKRQQTFMLIQTLIAQIDCEFNHQNYEKVLKLNVEVERLIKNSNVIGSHAIQNLDFVKFGNQISQAKKHLKLKENQSKNGNNILIMVASGLLFSAALFLIVKSFKKSE